MRRQYYVSGYFHQRLSPRVTISRFTNIPIFQDFFKKMSVTFEGLRFCFSVIVKRNRESILNCIFQFNSCDENTNRKSKLIRSLSALIVFSTTVAAHQHRWHLFTKERKIADWNGDQWFSTLVDQSHTLHTRSSATCNSSMASHQDWTNPGWRSGHATWSLDDLWAAFTWV